MLMSVYTFTHWARRRIFDLEYALYHYPIKGLHQENRITCGTCGTTPLTQTTLPQTVVGTLYLWWRLRRHNRLWCHKSTTISLWGHNPNSDSLHHNINTMITLLYYGITPVNTTETCNTNVVNNLTI